MYIRCNAGDLKAFLTAATGFKGPKEILRHVLIDARYGSVKLKATDMERSISATLRGATVYTSGLTAVPFRRLSSLIRGKGVEKRDALIMADSDGAKVTIEPATSMLPVADPAEFPETDWPETGIERAEINGSRLLETLERVSVAACREEHRYQLVGVFFELSTQALTLTATDGKRLAHEKVPVRHRADLRSEDRMLARVIVPNASIATLLRMLRKVAGRDEMLELMIHEDGRLFVDGDSPWRFSTTTIAESYPDYTVAIPREESIKTRLDLSRESLLSLVESAAMVTDRETACVIFRASVNGVASLSLSAKSEIGEYQADVPVSHGTGEPMEWRLNPIYTIAALKALKGHQRVAIEIASPDRPVVLRAGGYRHMLMPLVVG